MVTFVSLVFLFIVPMVTFVSLVFLCIVPMVTFVSPVFLFIVFMVISVHVSPVVLFTVSMVIVVPIVVVCNICMVVLISLVFLYIVDTDQSKYSVTYAAGHIMSFPFMFVITIYIFQRPSSLYYKHIMIITYKGSSLDFSCSNVS